MKDFVILFDRNYVEDEHDEQQGKDFPKNIELGLRQFLALLEAKGC